MIRKFICGCDMPSSEALQGDRELKTLVTCAYDSEGFLTCSVHGQRRYGWRSLPIMDTSAGRRSDFSFSGYHPLTVERIVVFQEIPSSFEIPSVDIHPAQEDRRDNSDPETLGNSMLQMGSRPSNYPSNGHVNIPRRKPLNSKKGRELLEYQRRISGFTGRQGHRIRIKTEPVEMK